MKKIVLLASVLGALIFASGCGLSEWVQSTAPQFFQIKLRDGRGEDVEICSMTDGTCIVAEASNAKVYGIVRGGEFSEDDKRLCYPLGEYCDSEPLGPIVGGVEVKVWQFVSDDEVGALLANTYADEVGFFEINPLPGTYWVTFHKVGEDYRFDSKNKELFGKEKFHRIMKIIVPEEGGNKTGVYLQK